MNEGDLALISYTGKIAGGQVFDTTSKDVAKKAGVDDEKNVYKPALIAAGKGMLIKGLDDAILTAKVGVQTKVHISKDKAFGDRKQALVRLVNASQFRSHGIDPVAGMPVELDGVPARILSVSGGRVQVDFNHELAGHDLEYEFTVEKSFVSTQEKLNAIFQEHIKQNAKIEGDTVTVSVPPGENKDANYFIAKSRAVEWTFAYIPEVKNVKVVEEFSAPVKKEEKPAKEDAKKDAKEKTSDAKEKANEKV